MDCSLVFVDIRASPVLFPISPLSLVFAPIPVIKDPLSLSLVIPVLALVVLAVRPPHLALPVHLLVSKLAFVSPAVLPLILSLHHLILLEDSLERLSSDHALPVAVLESFYVVPFVEVPTRPHFLSLAVLRRSRPYTFSLFLNMPSNLEPSLYQ